MRPDLIAVHPNENRAGLQFADVVASAFFRASDIQQVAEPDVECAKLLKPRMARHPDREVQESFMDLE